MPATRSSSLGGNFKRRKVGASLRSKSAELTIFGASTLLTESSAVFLCRNVAFPVKLSPYSCLYRAPVADRAIEHRSKCLTMPGPGQFLHMHVVSAPHGSAQNCRSPAVDCK
ncbi:MAG: hypothetical protein NVSMB43_05470 [Pseudarthrobacter sp.]